MQAGTLDAPEPFAELGGTERPITAVVLDARGLAVERALLPRVLTQSGSVVFDIAQTDLNDVAEHGFCTYTPYADSASFQAGSRPLWLKVLGAAPGLASSPSATVMAQNSAPLVKAGVFPVPG